MGQAMCCASDFAKANTALVEKTEVPAHKDERIEQLLTLVASLQERPRVCVCGNVFMADAEFCRKCGVKRPGSQVCGCGNVFMPDAEFCRKCGVKRPVQGAQRPPRPGPAPAAPEGGPGTSSAGGAAGGPGGGPRPQSAVALVTLCPGLVVPPGCSCQLAIPVLGGANSLAVRDLAGEQLLSAEVSWPSWDRSSGQRPMVVLRASDDGPPLAYCKAGDSAPGGRRGVYVYKGSDELFAHITPVMMPKRSTYTLTSGRMGVQLFFEGNFAEHAVAVQNDQQELLADTEPSAMPFDPNRANQYYRLSAVEGSDIGLLLCALLSIDLMEAAPAAPARYDPPSAAGAPLPVVPSALPAADVGAPPVMGVEVPEAGEDPVQLPGLPVPEPPQQVCQQPRPKCIDPPPAAGAPLPVVPSALPAADVGAPPIMGVEVPEAGEDPVQLPGLPVPEPSQQVCQQPRPKCIDMSSPSMRRLQSRCQQPRPKCIDMSSPSMRRLQSRRQ